MNSRILSFLHGLVAIVGLVVSLSASAQSVNTLTAGTQALAYSFQVTVPGVSFAATGLPSGLTINATSGLISGTPASAGTSTGVITVMGSVTNNYSYSLTINPPAGTPVISAPTALTGTVGVAITPVQVAATNGPITGYNATGLPPGLAVDGVTGLISGTPTLAGSYTVSLSANNAGGTGAVRSITATIAAAANTPVVNSATTATGTPGTPFTYTITATNSPTSFTAAPLPLGLSLNAATGVISGTPTVAGTTDVALAAVNASGTSSVVTLHITLGALPVVTTTSGTGTVGSAFALTLQANPAATSFNVVGTLPAGLTFNGTNFITGTPTASGVTNLTVSGNNASGTGVTSTLTLTINAAGSGGGGGGGGGGGMGGGSVAGPVITVQPAGQQGAPGAVVTFAVTATGSDLRFQWYKNGVAVSGAQGSTFTINAVSATDAGIYSVVVYNSAGSVTSSAAALSLITPTAAPTITAQPADQSVLVGGTATFVVTATGTPTLSYQWLKDGSAINGATSASYVVSNAQLSDGGNYSVTVTNAVGSVSSRAAVLTVDASRLTNVSIRSVAGAGDQTLVAGFVTSGGGTKQILVRGIGPTLQQFGVGSPVADPQLQLLDSNKVALQQNDNWGGGSALSGVFAQVGAFSLPAGSKDAALVATVPVGGYTAHLAGSATPSPALVEVYDADTGTTGARLINVSGRCQVGTGDSVLIAGFVIDGRSPKRVLIRAIGPGLLPYGVSNVLIDPQLQLFDGNRQLIQQNDNWDGSAALTTAFTQAGAFTLGIGSKDAAMIVTLQPGNYTAQVSGVGGTTGIALVEIYELP